MNVPYLHTSAGLNVILHGRPYSISADNDDYEQLVKLVTEGLASEDDMVHAIEAKAQKAIAAVQLSPRMRYEHGTVFFDGEPIHNYAVDKLVELLDGELPVAPLVRFLERLQENTSFRVVSDLYRFLEHGGMPITPSGKFVAYKAVRPDWKDIHSGTIDNSIGQEVRVPRNRVDEDPDRTCSYGLHVCSYDYLPHFSHANGHVVAVEVAPEDVVAIPRDYNDTKMRVCCYRVLSEVTDYYKRGENVLTERGPLWHDDVTNFKVEADHGAGWEHEGWYEYKGDALNDAEEAVDNGAERARVLDNSGRQVALFSS